MKWTSKTKEIIAYGIAVMVALVGLGLCVAGFVVNPTGEIHSSVQWVLGEALVFVATVLGISYYARNAINSVRDNINHHIDKRISDHKQAEESL